MASPSIAAADTTSGSQASNSTSWTATHCGNIGAGDLLMLWVSADGSNSWASATGWTQHSFVSEGTVTLTLLLKDAAGTESGSLAVTIANSEQGVWRMNRIPASEWHGDVTDGIGIDVGAPTSGSGTGPNPGSNAQPGTWGSEDVLYVAAAASDHGNTTYTGFPTNYTQQDHTTAGGHTQESGGAGGAAMGIAYRKGTAGTEDPSAFTTDAAEGWVAVVVAVRAAAVVLARVPRGVRTALQAVARASSF